jgi:hypothetical protein
VSAADDDPLSDDLEEVRKLLFPKLTEAEGRALLRAIIKRAEEGRGLYDDLFDRLRPQDGGVDAKARWGRDVFADIDDRSSEELAQVVDWLDADPARADSIFESRLEAFQAGLRVGERL